MLHYQAELLWASAHVCLILADAKCELGIAVSFMLKGLSFSLFLVLLELQQSFMPDARQAA